MARGSTRTIFGKRGQSIPRQKVMQSTTIRDFSGGWNVIDNDLNLSSRFAKVLNNMLRQKDGSIGVRPGTRFMHDFSITQSDIEVLQIVDHNQNTLVSSTQQSVVTTQTLSGDMVDNPFTSANGQAKIIVAHPAHGFFTGYNVAFDGATTFNGVDESFLNISHVITVTDEDTYFFISGTTASADGAGGGLDVTYSAVYDKIDGDIVNATYYADRIVAVDNLGVLIEIDSLGNGRVIWDDGIGLAQPDAPGGWGETDFASFDVFNGELIVCNGIDKPLIVNFDDIGSPCRYLVDLASSANANVPVCRYVCAMPDYLVMAGDPLAPGTVYISNKRTSGTWFGDEAPNDAVNVDVGQVAQSQNNIIRGLTRFRTTLCVMFDDVTTFGKLGIYDADSNHTPDFSDSIQQNGTISHRSIQDLGNDVLMNDVFGVPSVERNKFTDSLAPNRLSTLIDPEIQKMIITLSVGSTEDRVFSVYDQREGRYYLFIPNGDTIATTTETRCFVYTSIDALKVQAWALITGWNWSCSCRSALGRIFFFKGKKMYVLGADEEPLYADRIGDPDIVTPLDGDAINFEWTMPWADFGKRKSVKTMRGMAFDHRGDSAFTANLFIDNLLDAPTLSLNFDGTQDERNYAFTTTFDIAKLQITGSTKKALSFPSITFFYQGGDNQR